MHVMMSVTLCNNELRVYNFTSLRRIIFFNYVNRVCDCTHVIRPQQNYNMLNGWNLHEEFFFLLVKTFWVSLSPLLSTLKNDAICTYLNWHKNIKVTPALRPVFTQYRHSFWAFRETVLFNRWEKAFVKFSIKIGF